MNEDQNKLTPPAEAGAPARRPMPRRLRRLVRPVPLAVLSMLFGSAVAAYATLFGILPVSFSCDGPPLRGENVLHGLALAFAAGLTGPGLLWLAFILPVLPPRAWRAIVAAVCVLDAAALAGAIAFVALDSGTYVQQDSACAFSSGSGISSAHFEQLYALWGGTIAVILLGAIRVLRERHAPTSH